MFKEPKLKANHNLNLIIFKKVPSIYQCSKNRNWKQITTICSLMLLLIQYLSMFKEPKLKANHNRQHNSSTWRKSIYQCSKNRNWKQITTTQLPFTTPSPVFINVQRTEIESKSQLLIVNYYIISKYLSMFKEPKLKANHNCMTYYKFSNVVFINVQRTEIESKSQQ